MEKPVLSPDFTIEDIHKLREYNYEITKNMSFNDVETGISSTAQTAQAAINNVGK